MPASLIAVPKLSDRPQTRRTNKGPNPEAKADQEKVTKAKTLLFPAKAIAKITAVTLRVPIFANL